MLFGRYFEVWTGFNGSHLPPYSRIAFWCNLDQIPLMCIPWRCMVFMKKREPVWLRDYRPLAFLVPTKSDSGPDDNGYYNYGIKMFSSQKFEDPKIWTFIGDLLDQMHYKVTTRPTSQQPYGLPDGPTGPPPTGCVFFGHARHQDSFDFLDSDKRHFACSAPLSTAAGLQGTVRGSRYTRCSLNEMDRVQNLTQLPSFISLSVHRHIKLAWWTPTWEDTSAAAPV